MAWTGYVQYGGTEIINVARTQAYAAWAHLPWFRPLFDADSLSTILGDLPYVDPKNDPAPWTDPDFEESYGFYGVYPLDVQGLEDSSRTSTVVESIRDGGYPGRLRHGTKTVVFNTVLIGDSDAAVNYGFGWLKQALLAGPCGPPDDCTGSDLCYLASEPNMDLSTLDLIVTETGPTGLPVDVDGGVPAGGGSPVDVDGGVPSGDIAAEDVDGGTPLTGGASGAGTITVSTTIVDCLTPLLRSLRKVIINSGPTITAKNTTSDGAEAWTVQFTAVAGEPWEYGAEIPVIEGFLDPAVPVPWVGGVIPPGGYLDLDGAIYNEKSCATPVFMPLQDPLCIAITPPPLPPSVGLGCYTPPVNWRRRQITIPADYIPLWGEVVPIFQVQARTHDVRNLRLRFYADVDEDGDISDDPCAFCGDIVVSYVPAGSTLVFDTSLRSVYVTDATQTQRRADSVVYATDGTPFDWPVLTCGFGYIVTLDLPQTQYPPVFDLSLVSRVT